MNMKKYTLLLVSSLLLASATTVLVKAEKKLVEEGTELKITKVFSGIDGQNITPNVDFSFEISPYSQEITETTKDNLDVMKGIDSKTVKVSYKNGTKDSIQHVIFDFKQIKFPKAGIYRYTVKEGPVTVPGITRDDREYVVDLYVLLNQDSGDFVPKYVVSYQSNQKEKKPIEFKNELKTTKLKIVKKVTGNAGEKDRKFDFVVNLEANQEYSKGQKVILTRNTRDSENQDIVFEIGKDNAFQLKNDESLELTNLPYGIKYSVKETKVDNYEQTATFSEGDNNLSVPYNLGTSKTSDETPDEIIVTNKREGIIPTGVVSTIVPYVALSAVAIGGAVYMLKKKEA